ncbi:hypothetical protein ACHAXT_009795 [Thalassiosira profunda]
MMERRGSRSDQIDDSERTESEALDVSLSIRDLEHSHRSGGPMGSSVLGGHLAEMEMEGEAEGDERHPRQTMQHEAPLATPASSDPGGDLGQRMGTAVPPPLPMNHISPSPAAAPPLSVGDTSRAHTHEGVESPPPTPHSQALAALYQSSRRSRGTNTPGAKEGLPLPSAAILPPPPFAVAGASPGDAADNAVAGEKGEGDPNKISLQSSSGFHESWNTSMSSLMASGSFLNSSSVYNPRGSVQSSIRASLQSQGGAQGQGPQSSQDTQGHAIDSAPAPRKRGERPPRPIGFNLADYQMVDRTSDRRLSDGSHDPSVPTTDGIVDPGSTKVDGQRFKDLAEFTMDAGDASVHLTVPTFSEESESAPAPPPRRGALGEQTKQVSARDLLGEQLSHLQVRTREEFTNDAKKAQGSDGKGSNGSSDEGSGGRRKGEPPSKRRNRRRSVEVKMDRESQDDSPGQDSQDYLTPHTQKSCVSSTSFDIIAHPSSRVSSIHGFGDESPMDDANVQAVLRDIHARADFEAGMRRIRQEAERRRREDEQQARDVTPHTSKESPGPEAVQVMIKPDDPRDETASAKERRIVRRKVQRLLLIRHCSTCPVPNTSREGRSSPVQACPATSHCAEGKALCAHIRTCRDDKCTFKKCRTSREVLGHYKSCTDKYCDVCGPVRAADKGRHRRQRSDDNSSIETIDDAFWLNANMVASDHPIEGGPDRPMGEA